MAQWSVDPAAIEAEVEHVRSLGLDELREAWRATFRSSPPSAFNKDLIVRFICWHVQERALGGLDPATATYLEDIARGKKLRTERRLKTGTVLVREYNRERHTVTVVPGGYVWRETTYTSLSTIARAITGTAWNGPRFFGLRTDKAFEAGNELKQGDGDPGVATAERRSNRRIGPPKKENNDAR